MIHLGFLDETKRASLGLVEMAKPSSFYASSEYMIVAGTTVMPGEIYLHQLETLKDFEFYKDSANFWYKRPLTSLNDLTYLRHQVEIKL